jgi:hypothetical protein
MGREGCCGFLDGEHGVDHCCEKVSCGDCDLVTGPEVAVAARVRELVDQGTGLDAACRIVTLEDQLNEAQRQNTELRATD